MGINVFTADGTLALSNAAAARIIGTTEEHLATMNFRQIASWRTSGLLAAAEAVLATGEPGRSKSTSSRLMAGKSGSTARSPVFTPAANRTCSMF